MATHRKEQLDLWASLLKLANNDDKLVRAAALRATDAEGRVNLKAVKRHILDTTNPAMLATVEAAFEFATAINSKDKLIDLPHLHSVYEMAIRDTSLPRRIFNEAADGVKNGQEINQAIHTAIAAQTLRYACH